jgi:hypothetical protein
MTVDKKITFTAVPYVVKTQLILRLPETASKQLSSRGQIAVTGVIKGQEFQTVLEPDGYWGHWMRIDKKLQASARIAADQEVTVTLVQTKNWPEPTLPGDVAAALARAPQKVNDKWQDITPMARWEWVRWIGATTSTDTRAIRIEKTVSKLNGKHRRPCCFNLAACTDMELSKSGRLIERAD